MEDRDACLMAGMCDYASKPVKWEVLAAILTKAHTVKLGLEACRCSSTTVTNLAKG